MTFFKVSDIYLIGPAKKIFRKFPKMDFLKNVLILPPTILLHRVESTDKTHCFKASLAKYITDLCPNQVFLGLAHDSTIPKDDFEPTKIYKIKNCLNQGYWWLAAIVVHCEKGVEKFQAVWSIIVGGWYTISLKSFYPNISKIFWPIWHIVQ